MAYEAIFENVYALLAADPDLVPSILGPRLPQNQRLYRANPQVEQRLSTYEPTQPAEGWVIIEEPLALQRFMTSQITSNHEYVTLTFRIYGTTYRVGHAVLDVLDRYLHWTVSQQRVVQWGDRWLLFTRRHQQEDQYNPLVKLPEKRVHYALEFVREDELPDA